MGSGLGSSAAFAVALAAALLEWQMGPCVSSSSGVEQMPNEDRLDLICKWAFVSERLMHGTPSGIDNYVSTYGGAVTYVKSPRVIEQLHNFPEYPLLITDTCQPRKGKALIAGVKRLKCAHAAVVENIFAAIQGIVDEFIANLNDLERCGELISMNQGLLNAVGVGHEKIDAVCNICSQFGAASKLTGAGGGGCVLSLLPRDISKTKTEELSERLRGENFRCFQCKAGGDGVLVKTSFER